MFSFFRLSPLGAGPKTSEIYLRHEEVKSGALTNVCVYLQAV